MLGQAGNEIEQTDRCYNRSDREKCQTFEMDAR